MDVRTLTTSDGTRLIVLPEVDYTRLIKAAEDNADRQAVAEFRRRIASGEEELMSSAMLDRLMAGERRIKVWREHRGLTASALAAKAEVGQGYLSQIEAGTREGKLETLRKIAGALNITLDDLAG